MTGAQDTLIVTRSLGAPREQIWRAWTEPDVLARWWWPERFQTAYDVDLRVRGRYRFRTAELPDIGVLSLAGEYLEVQRPEWLVYSWEWENQGEARTQVTVELSDRCSRTEARVTHQGFATAEERQNHVVGWNDCIDRLEAMLDGRPS